MSDSGLFDRDQPYRDLPMCVFRTFLLLTMGSALLQDNAALGAVSLQRIDFGQYPEHSFIGPSEWRPATASWGFALVEGSATMRFSDGTSAGLLAGISIGLSGHPLGEWMSQVIRSSTPSAEWR